VRLAVRDAVANAVQSQLSTLVSQGQITQQQADAIVNAIKNGRGFPGLGGFGPHGHRGPRNGGAGSQSGGNSPSQ